MRAALAIACVLALAPTIAQADNKAEAKQHVQRATAAHAAGRFADALKELSIAYSLDPQPELLFAIGQVQMKLGDCDAATTFYQRFLETKPGPREAKIVEKAIATCKQHAPPVEPAPARVVVPAMPIEPIKPAEVPAPAEPPRVVHAPAKRPWYRDWIGDALVSAGAISGVIALVEYRGAVASRSSADTATTYGTFQDELDAAHRDRSLAIGFGAGAIVLVGAGVVHYLAGGHSEERAVAIVPIRGGEVVTWGASF